MIEHPRQNNNNNNNNNSSNNNLTGSKSSLNQQQQPHFDNKVYERFEPYMMQQGSKTSHKRSPSSDSISSRINLGKMKLNFHLMFIFKFFKYLLAGAKLVLPTGGEIPQLKPVNMNRPRLAPPGNLKLSIN